MKQPAVALLMMLLEQHHIVEKVQVLVARLGFSLVHVQGLVLLLLLLLLQAVTMRVTSASTATVSQEDGQDAAGAGALCKGEQLLVADMLEASRCLSGEL